MTISMSLPVLFKPTLVEAMVPVTPFNQDPTAYQGFWIDGGVLNNLPLHAFDRNRTEPALAESTVEPFNPRVVALRLTEGQPGLPPTVPDPAAVRLGDFLGDVGNTLLFPSEGGQVRTAAEAEQTIELYTYDLQTTEFAPPPEASQTPIEEA